MKGAAMHNTMWFRIRGKGQWRLLAAAAAAALACLGVRSGARAADFSKGFAKFHELGLPDVGKAEYVTVEAYGWAGSFDSRSYFLRQMGLSGNGWMLTEPKAGQPGRFVLDETRTVELYDSQDLQRIQREERRRKETEARKTASQKTEAGEEQEEWDDFAMDWRSGGRWKRADLADDIRKVTDALSGKSLRDEQRRSLEYQLREGTGRVFLFAANVASKGYTNEAGAIVQALFEKAGDSRQVIAAGLNQLADGQYDEAYAAFLKTYDWRAYDKALLALLARFPTGWSRAGAVRRLEPLVKARVEMTVPPAPEGAGLTDEDLALASELCQPVSGRPAPGRPFGAFRHDVWLLPEGRQRGMPFERGTSAVDRVVARGVQSVPLLIALAGDDTLTCFRREEIGALHVYMDRDAAPDERDRQLFNQMKRPITRADLARAMLSPLVITGEDYDSRLERLSDEEFQQEAQVWYDRVKSLSPRELAMTYVKEGTGNQKQSALRHLIKTTEKAQLRDLEQYLYDPENPDSGFDMVCEYLYATGGETNELAQRYLANLREATEARVKDEGGAGYRRSLLQSMSNRIEQIEGILSGATAEDMLKAVMAGEKQTDEVYSVLHRRLENEDHARVFDMLLKGAVGAKDPEVSVWMIGMLSGFSGSSRGRRAEAGAAPAIGKYTEEWRTLLSATSSEGVAAFDESQGVAVAAANAILTIYAPRRGMTERQSHYRLYELGTRGARAIIGAAQAVLDGKPEAAALPDLSEENVSDARKKELIESVKAAAGASAVKAALDRASLDEWLALTAAAGKDKGLNARLMPLANRIVKVDTRGGDAESEAMKREWADGALSRGVVEKIVAYARRQMADNKDVDIVIARAPCLDGVTVAFRDPSAAARRARRRGAALPEGREKVLNAAVSAGRSAAPVLAAWPSQAAQAPQRTVVGETNAVAAVDDLIKEELAQLEKDLQSYDEQSRDAFWSKVDALGGNEVNACRPAGIQFSTQPAWAGEMGYSRRYY